MTYKSKVFLSGGFNSNWQLIVTDKLKDEFVFFNPKEHGLEHSDFYTIWDIHFIKECDIMFVNILRKSLNYTLLLLFIPQPTTDPAPASAARGIAAVTIRNAVAAKENGP